MDDSSIIDLGKKRNEFQERRKREFERVIFDNFLGVYTVLDIPKEIVPIQMIDISTNGCMFQIPIDSKYAKTLKKSTGLDLRFYFTKDSYMLLSGDIRYCKEFRDIDDLYYLRFGFEFNKDVKSYEALSAFINFIIKFSEHSLSDKNSKVVLHY